MSRALSLRQTAHAAAKCAPYRCTGKYRRSRTTLEEIDVLLRAAALNTKDFDLTEIAPPTRVNDALLPPLNLDDPLADPKALETRFDINLTEASIRAVLMGLVEDTTIDQPPSEYLKLLYFDSITHSQDVLEALIRRFGADRVMLGSDHPAGMGNFTPAAAVTALDSLSADERESILSGNATRIFGLAGALARG